MQVAFMLPYNLGSAYYTTYYTTIYILRILWKIKKEKEKKI